MIPSCMCEEEAIFKGGITTRDKRRKTWEKKTAKSPAKVQTGMNDCALIKISACKKENIDMSIYKTENMCLSV